MRLLHKDFLTFGRLQSEYLHFEDKCIIHFKTTKHLTDRTVNRTVLNSNKLCLEIILETNPKQHNKQCFYPSVPVLLVRTAH